MEGRRELLHETAELAAAYLESLDERAVAPPTTPEEMRERLGGPLPEEPRPALDVVRELAEAAEPGIVGSAGGRYFGFVIGAAVPAALAADWLTSTWDQNAAGYAASPAAAVVEEVCRAWLVELLRLPPQASFALTTGCQMAHVTALAAARFELLRRAGWDLHRDGLAGSPPLRVVAGEQRHVSLDRALRLLGIGTAAMRLVDADEQGRMRSDALAAALAESDRPTILCAQAGEVNTGAFDPLEDIAELAERHGAWLHVDGAFGLWAAASERLRPLVAGAERADSWATDAHKWLNVPYDSGLAFCAHPEAHMATMSVTASYLVFSPEAVREQAHWTPDLSRRARGFAVYAALRSLGRAGVAALVERCCAHAARMATELRRLPDVEVLNDVVLNQVLLRVGDDARTEAVIRAVQEDGRAWIGGTRWAARAAIRISVSSWATSDDDIGRTLAAIADAVAATRPVTA